MSMNGLGLLSPNEGRAFELAPGERIRHRRPVSSSSPFCPSLPPPSIGKPSSPMARFER